MRRRKRKEEKKKEKREKEKKKDKKGKEILADGSTGRPQRDPGISRDLFKILIRGFQKI